MASSAGPGGQGLWEQADLWDLPASDPESTFLSHSPDVGSGSPAAHPWLYSD